MFRTFVCALLAVILCTVVVVAKEVTAKAKKCDGKTLCIVVDGKEVELKITDKTQWLSGKGEAMKDKQKDGLTKAISDGKEPELTVDYDEGSKEVKSIKGKGKKAQ